MFNWEKVNNTKIKATVVYKEDTYEIEAGIDSDSYYTLCNKKTDGKSEVVFVKAFNFINFDVEDLIMYAEMYFCKNMRIDFDKNRSYAQFKEIVNAKEWKKSKFKN